MQTSCHPYHAQRIPIRPTAWAAVVALEVSSRAMDCPAVWAEPHQDLHPGALAPRAYNPALFQDYDPARAFPGDYRELFF